MEKFIQPCKLDIDPVSNTAGKEWKQWLKTFENYIDIITEALPED